MRNQQEHVDTTGPISAVEPLEVVMAFLRSSVGNVRITTIDFFTKTVAETDLNPSRASLTPPDPGSKSAALKLLPAVSPIAGPEERRCARPGCDQVIAPNENGSIDRRRKLCGGHLPKAVHQKHEGPAGGHLRPPKTTQKRRVRSFSGRKVRARS